MEVVYVSHTPDSGLWKVCVSVDQGLKLEVVYVSHMPHSISGKLSVRLDRGLRVDLICPRNAPFPVCHVGPHRAKIVLHLQYFG